MTLQWKAKGRFASTMLVVLQMIEMQKETVYVLALCIMLPITQSGTWSSCVHVVVSELMVKMSTARMRDSS